MARLISDKEQRDMLARMFRELADKIEVGKVLEPISVTVSNEYAQAAYGVMMGYKPTGRSVMVLDYRDAERAGDYIDWRVAHPDAAVMPMEGV